MTSPSRFATDALRAARECEAWAAIRLRDSDTVTVLGGTPERHSLLVEIPLEDGVPAAGRRFDRLVAVPFQQVAERGFEVQADDAPLVAMRVEVEHEVPLAEFLASVPPRDLTFSDQGGFETSDAEYAEVVRTIIDREIGNGEGANMVIGRNFRARLQNWDGDQALSVLRTLLANERGAYWTFCFYTGERYLVGASPERHVSVHGGDVRMNPISGTFRLRGVAPEDRKARLLEFLADEKEIYELFMVVDEELKMMCDICNEGGQVLGPFLKPMTHLVHTEYLLAGRTTHDVREVLKDTMFAATVTGSPVQNAVRLIKQYESSGRGYYAGALALLGRDLDGEPTADSPIVIRTAEVRPDGALKVTAGATLVRDSDPDSEVAETRAKASGILSAFGLVEPAQAPESIADLANDEDVLIALARRNQRLSKFWLTDQSGSRPAPELIGKRAVILDGEDDFVNMLRHVLAVLGMSSSIVRARDYAPGIFEGADLVIVGPGPGDPRDGDHPKIGAMQRAVDELLAAQQPFLAVCLGHQVLCHQLGLPLAYKDIVFQGTQSPVTLGDRVERVGFYNTFVARPERELPRGVRVEADPQTRDVHLIAGPSYRGIQFHAESILTENGFDLLRGLILELLA